ncbi:MAG: acyl-CoA thioesterase [Flavobacteriales bacterium]|nr:acyl-CoA thioesterase [Flavobacteriales bacterium]|tara:strand:+ start:421 stop:933 length:513 start_codon:yes stop_codon:yes gene_type:complete
MKEFKNSKDSLSILTEVVLPNDTNNLDNLMGGRLLHWMDIAAAISAYRHSNSIVVTASVNNVSFNHAIPRGSIVTLHGKVSRAFTSSMEVFIDVWYENRIGEKIKCNEAIYTFVAVNKDQKPIKIPQIKPESIEEKTRFEGALRRRQLSLILAGKMSPDEATELKSLFIK